MPIFTSPDNFEEHKQYVPLLKKALLLVKPDAQKKFLYFKQYPFGAKKLPLVLVDFDPKCPAAFASAGYKPTDEGIVSLTSRDELNFEPKKGNLKRIQLKKYFATMGGGIKEVYVPPGEVDDEAGPQLPGATQPVPPTPAQAVPPSAPPAVGEDEMAKFKKRLGALLPQIKANPQLKVAAGTKDEKGLNVVAGEAGVFAGKKDFTKANQLLDTVESLLTKPGSAADSGPTLGIWQQAKEAVDAQLAGLYDKLKKSGLPVLNEVANEIESVLGNYRTGLVKALMEYDQAAGPKKEQARAKALEVVTAYQTSIPQDKHVIAADTNPFGFKITVRETLGGALASLGTRLKAG